MSTQEKEKEKEQQAIKVDSGCCSTPLTKEQELKKAEEAKLAAEKKTGDKKPHAGGCCGG
jgi:hypothetical protein